MTTEYRENNVSGPDNSCGRPSLVAVDGALVQWTTSGVTKLDLDIIVVWLNGDGAQDSHWFDAARDMLYTES